VEEALSFTDRKGCDVFLDMVTPYCTHAQYCGDDDSLSGCR
jgi:hypothetical protein